MERRAQDRGVLIRVEAPEPAGSWETRFPCERCLYNVLENAIRYTPAGGRVAVLVSATAVTCF